MVNVPKNNHLQWSLVCLTHNIYVFAVLQTWVVVKYDIKKVLVTPRDIEFILLEKGHQNFIPSQCNCCHVVLARKNTTFTRGFISFALGNHKPAILEKVCFCPYVTSTYINGYVSQLRMLIVMVSKELQEWPQLVNTGGAAAPKAAFSTQLFNHV